MAKSEITINPHFDNVIFDWDYEQYLFIGSYGSSKSHSAIQKIILKLFEEKRKCCIFRQTYASIKDSTFDLVKEILSNANLLDENNNNFGRKKSGKIQFKVSPYEFLFPNGSSIIFKGLDNVDRVKSLNGVSIVMIEEASEISESAFNEILGRIRKEENMHFILACNPVDRNNWIFKRFFARVNEKGKEVVILKEQTLYKMRELVSKKNNVYYHHSICEDNKFLPKAYIKRLDELKNVDKALYLVARHGMFGTTGIRVLPQFEVMDAELVKTAAAGIKQEYHRVGMDFGFVTSYNAVIKCCFDPIKKYLYIYKEYYKNNMTDDKTAIDLVKWDAGIKDCLIKADCAEPKSIQYYRDQGFNMIRCRKVADKKAEGSRIANTKKVKRFNRIICSSDCINTIRELKDLTYKKDKDDVLSKKEFNIDPHTLSAIWYALDDYNVSNLKEYKSNSRKGSEKTNAKKRG